MWVEWRGIRIVNHHRPMRRYVQALLAAGLHPTWFDGNEALHERAAEALLAATPPRSLSPFVLAELDYLIGNRIGSQARLALVSQVVSGAYRLETFDADDMRDAQRLMERYSELRIGLADASVVVLANRLRTLDLLCTDARHFRAIRAAGGRHFRLLPADAV